MNNKLNPELIQDLLNPGNINITPGLERMQQILPLLNNPQHKYKIIHITGTNGKGSTAAFIETALVHAKLKVGKFTSPHIHKINECITLNQQEISDKDLERVYFKIKGLLVTNNLTLSPFEFLTALMFEYFANHKIDWLVLEVGMGGENDATNVVNSSYSIITNVELEHTRWLGNTLVEIANAKAGIIKNGLTIIADNKPELIQAVSARTNNYIDVLDKYKPIVEMDPVNFRTNVTLENRNGNYYFPRDIRHGDYAPLAWNKYSLNLFGKFQACNFLCAYAVLTDMGLGKEHIKYAAEHTLWPGRLQVVTHNPLILLDATHNEAGAKSLVNSLSGIYKPNEVMLITSILRDKNILAMLSDLAQLATSVIYTSIDNNPRGMLASELAILGAGIFEHELCVDHPIQALATAKKMGKKVILITGSLYLLSYFNL